MKMILLVKTTFCCLMCFLLFTIPVYGQNTPINGKEYLLVEKVDTLSMSKEDKEVLTRSLEEYHGATSDTAKIHALDGICEGMNSIEWRKYQSFQLKLIRIALQKDLSESEMMILKKSLAAALNNVGYIFSENGDSDSSMIYYIKSMEIKREIGDSLGMALSNINIAQSYKGSGKIPEALVLLKSSLKTLKAIGHKKQQSIAYNNLAQIYHELGDTDQSIKCLMDALRISEEIGEKVEIGFQLNNLGLTFAQQGLYDKAITYYTKAYNINTQIGAERSIAFSLGNLANANLHKGDTILAMEQLNQSLQIYSNIGRKLGMAKCYQTLGKIKESQSKLNEALIFYTKSVQLSKEIGNKEHLITSLNLTAAIQTKLKNYSVADSTLLQAEKLSLEGGYLRRHFFTLELQSLLAEAKNDPTTALQLYKKFMKEKEAIVSETAKEAAIRQQIRYEVEKSQLLKETELNKVQAKKDKRLLIYIGIGVIAALIFGFLVYIKFSRLSQSRKLAVDNLQSSKSDLTAIVADNKMRFQYRANILESLQSVGNAKDEDIRKALKGVILDLKQQMQVEEKHNVVQDNIEIINADFEQKLKEVYPDLSITEIEICQLIKLNLSIQEIANIRKTSRGAIKAYRHRIRKKMNLDEEDLTEAIQKIGKSHN